MRARMAAAKASDETYKTMNYLPIFVDLSHSRCLVVGAGEVAQRKIETLLKAKAAVVVVSTSACAAVAAMADSGDIELELREYTSTDIDWPSLVVAATGDQALNARVAQDARRCRIPVNVVDNPTLSSFIMPSIVDRSPVLIAVSTGGAAPVLARILRSKLETMVPSSYGRLAELMHDFRERVRKRIPKGTARRRFWEQTATGSVAERIFEGKEQAAEEALEALLAGTSTAAPSGEVYLVGGGPGDPDLLTFRALRLMQQADVVVYDRLVAPQIVDLCRKDAERIFVGKQRDHHALDQTEISTLLVRLSREGKRVVRLKGGDPFLFGRGGEEIDTLATNGIAFQIVPGVTAASGCAAYAGIPLTHRDHAQQCVFVTGHQKDGKTDLPWEALVQPQQTIAVYMGMHGVEQFCAELIAHQMSPETPAAIIERGTMPDQRVLVSTVAELPVAAKNRGYAAPAIIIVGEVVRLRDRLAWCETAAKQPEPQPPGSPSG